MAAMEALLKIKADVQGEGKIDALGKSLGGLQKTAKSVGSGLSGIAGSLGGFGGVLGSLAGLASGAGLAALAKNAIDTADNLRDMSIRTGVSVEMLSKLKTAAEMSGATIEDVGKVLTKTAVAIANAPGNALNATAGAVAAGTNAVKMSIAQQVQLFEQREQQQIAAIRAGADRQIAEVQERERRQIDTVRAGMDRAVDAVKQGEQRQIDAVDRAADARISSMERETDARLREINRRYRQEEKLLNDGFDDRRSKAQQSADDEQRIFERQIERRFEAQRKRIQADKSLSDTAREALLQQLQDMQEAELTALRRGFAERAKVQDRAFRDQQEREQQSIEERKRAEEDAEKARLEASRKAAQDRAKTEKDAISKVSAERQAAIKKQAAEEERILKANSAAQEKAIKDAMNASIKEIQSGVKRAQDAYAKLGVALRNQDGSARKTGDVLMDVFDALQKLPEGAERTAALFDLYGKAGPKMASMFAMGREEVENLAATFTTDFANAADDFNDKQVKIGASFQKLGVSIGEAFLPIAKSLADAAIKIADFAKANPGLTKGLMVVGGIVSAIVIAAPGILAALTIAGKIATAVTAMKVGATIAGWLGVVGPTVAKIILGLGGIITWITGTLVPFLVSVFSGPVGWTVLAVAAVVAMAIAFREPIMEFFGWLAGAIGNGLQALWAWGEPIRAFWAGVWNQVVDFARGSLEAIGGVISWAAQAWYAILWQLFVQPWINLWNVVLKEPVMGAIDWIGKGLVMLGNAITQALAGLIKIAYQVYVKPWVDLWQNVFREPVLNAVNWLQTAWTNVSKGFNQYVTQPIQKGWRALLEFLPNAMRTAVSFVQNAWTGMINTIRNALRSFIVSIANSINRVGGLVNRLIRAFNALPGPDIGLVPTLSVPAFATGGFVNRATVGLVGEAGPEYIIPENKMAAASSRYLSGARGSAVLSTGSANVSRSTDGAVTINVKTGPVMEFQGERYVKLEELDRAMRITAEGVIGRLRTPAARRALGVT